MKHADETSWPVSGKNGWAWAFATDEVAVFLMEPTRSGKVPQAVLGEDIGSVLVRDEYSGYAKLPHEVQTCWAHLLREAESVAQARETLAPQQLEREIERIDRMLIDACRWRTRSDEMRHVQKRVGRSRRERLTFLRRSESRSDEQPGRAGDSAPGAREKGKRRKSLLGGSACAWHELELHPVAEALRGVLHRLRATTRHAAGTANSARKLAAGLTCVPRRELTCYRYSNFRRQSHEMHPRRG